MRNPGNQAANCQEPASASYLSGDTVEYTMFSCCLLTTRGSDLRNSRRRRLAGVWRRWVYPRLQRLWPFSHRHMRVTQHSQVQDDTGLGETESAQTLEEPCRGTRISADKLEKLVNHLVPSLKDGDPSFVSAFLFSYRRFATTQQVLNLLFKRYGFLRRFCEQDNRIKSTIHTLLETWLDIYPEDFCQSSDLSILNQLMAYLLLNMPCSNLATRVHMLLTELEDQKSSESGVQDLEGCTSADPELQAYLPAVDPVTLESEPAGVPSARCGSRIQASTSAGFCGSLVSVGPSADTVHLSHLPPLLQWVCLMQERPRQPCSSSGSQSSVGSLTAIP